MVGITRSRVSFFMNRFRKLGFIECNGRIRVRKSLLNVILHDQLPDQNAKGPTLRGRQAKKKSPAITDRAPLSNFAQRAVSGLAETRA